MIGYLRGRILDLDTERVTLDVHGVGYELAIPVPTFYELERHGRDVEVSLHVHTHVREDAIALYGFWTPRERQLFERLIAVSGIGPRLARVVLSGMPPEALAAAVAAGDVGRLGTIPGVGKKTAERMVLELRDRMGELTAAAATPAAGGEELAAALLNLGYRRSEAERAVAAVEREAADADFADKLRRALRQLSRV
ncbi:MAG TPA: Holliday junction branch migration protein RuvA [Thermoanaerobaculia bacterium]|nr:Holliday junction branch migration protein RuvA [Thermoanaerobaculia bacterium]